jgi:hypothetical protein
VPDDADALVAVARDAATVEASARFTAWNW